MNNNFILSILVHKGILELDEAEKLAKELSASIHSQTFTDAHKVVEKIFRDFEAKAKKHFSL